MADCVNNKIDSNKTGLSFAEEVCAKQLPNLADDGHDPEWFELEPNSYDDTGGDITTKARKPLNSNRRRKKGTPVDLDVTVGFNQDFTQHNTNRLLQGFFFANMHEKPTTKPLNGDQITVTAAEETGDYFIVASGGLAFKPGMIIKVSGPGVLNADNMGIFTVTTGGTSVHIPVTDPLVDEVFSGEVIITVVGYQFAADEVNFVAPADIGTLTMDSNPVAASRVLTITSTNNAADTETVTIGSVVYTFKTAAAAPYEVTVGADKAASLANLALTINGDNLLTPNQHPDFAATSDATSLTITARIAGTAFNGVATTETLTNGSWAGGTTTGGTGTSFLLFGFQPGEWVFQGGDDANTFFEDNVGYGRILSVSASELVFDKTTFEVSAVDGAGLSIRLYFGSVLLDEDDEVTRYFQFERTLGRDADGVQAQYLLGNVANELTFNLETADNVTVDLKFIGADESFRTGAQVLKDGDRFEAYGEDAYNTSSNVFRVRMSEVVAGNSAPTAFFGYITKGTITINNNVTPVKAIGAFGGIDVSVGTFEVGGEATALFQNVLANRGIRENADITIDMIFAKANEGFIFDIPLLALGGGRLDISENDPVTVPLTEYGAENPNRYTILYNTFDYLPNAAMPVVTD